MWTDNIDKIFVISTFDEIGQQRWPDIGKELTIKKIPSFRRYEAIKNRKDGATGLLHTMRILFDENPEQSILVFEDDAKFLREDVNEIMELAVAQLPEDWDCLYLGCNLLVPPTKYSDNLLKIKSAYSSHAILYSKKATELILSLWSDGLPYDNFLMQKIQIYGNCYCVNPLLCSQKKGVSSIFEYKPGKQIGIERYYDTGTKEMDWGLMMEERFDMFTKNL